MRLLPWCNAAGALVLLAGCAHADAGAAGAAAPTVTHDPRVSPSANGPQLGFTIAYRHGHLVGETSWRVPEGSTVTLAMSSDDPRELTLDVTGLGVTGELDSDEQTVMQFVADRVGSFVVRVDETGTKLGVLRVTPG